MMFIMSFNLCLRIFIDICEYAIEIIYISDNRKKGTYLCFNVVPQLVL